MFWWIGAALPCARTGCPGLGLFEVQVDFGAGPLGARLCLACLSSIPEFLETASNESRAIRSEGNTGGLIDHEM